MEKRHQSAITRDIWLHDAETNSHKMLTTLPVRIEIRSLPRGK